MPWPITIDDVLAAEKRIRPYLAPTPLRRYAALDEAVGLRVLVKHENHQPTCAFKVRNGLAAITSLSAEDRNRGVISASTGNHGQGVAYAGMVLGVKVTICVPVGANPEKVAAMKGFGARIVEEGEDFDASLAVMRRLAAAEGLVELHGVNHRMMPCGAGTLMLEVVEQAAAMGETIGGAVIAIGGGSQAVGGMTVLRARLQGTKVFGVQAAGAATIHDAWQARRIRGRENAKPQAAGTVTSGEEVAGIASPVGTGLATNLSARFVANSLGPPIATFAEGLATRSTYALTFDALCEGLADFVTVTDAEMAEAMRLLLRTTHNLAEPAGAAGLAATIKMRPQLEPCLAGRAVVVTISGANVSAATLRTVVTEQK